MQHKRGRNALAGVTGTAILAAAAFTATAPATAAAPTHDDTDEWFAMTVHSGEKPWNAIVRTVREQPADAARIATILRRMDRRAAHATDGEIRAVAGIGRADARRLLRVLITAVDLERSRPGAGLRFVENTEKTRVASSAAASLRVRDLSDLPAADPLLAIANDLTAQASSTPTIADSSATDANEGPAGVLANNGDLAAANSDLTVADAPTIIGKVCDQNGCAELARITLWLTYDAGWTTTRVTSRTSREAHAGTSWLSVAASYYCSVTNYDRPDGSCVEPNPVGINAGTSNVQRSYGYTRPMSYRRKYVTGLLHATWSLTSIREEMIGNTFVGYCDPNDDVCRWTN